MFLDARLEPLIIKGYRLFVRCLITRLETKQVLSRLFGFGFVWICQIARHEARTCRAQPSKSGLLFVCQLNLSLFGWNFELFCRWGHHAPNRAWRFVDGFDTLARSSFWRRFNFNTCFLLDLLSLGLSLSTTNFTPILRFNQFESLIFPFNLLKLFGHSCKQIFRLLGIVLQALFLLNDLLHGQKPRFWKIKRRICIILLRLFAFLIFIRVNASFFGERKDFINNLGLFWVIFFDKVMSFVNLSFPASFHSLVIFLLQIDLPIKRI